MGGCALRKVHQRSANDAQGLRHDSKNDVRKTQTEVEGRSADVREAFLYSYLKLDSRCPLDERQVYGLTKSWKAINRNMSVTAINMFVRLFETNTDIKSMFSKFKDVTTISDLRSSKVLEGHALKVICTIDDVIVNLDDMDYVLRMLQIVAQSHSQRFPHFDPEFFWKIEEPFILAVKEELGDRFTISMATTYRTIIQFIVGTLNSEFKRSREAQQSTQQQAQNQAQHRAQQAAERTGHQQALYVAQQTNSRSGQSEKTDGQSIEGAHLTSEGLGNSVTQNMVSPAAYDISGPPKVIPVPSTGRLDNSINGTTEVPGKTTSTHDSVTSSTNADRKNVSVEFHNNSKSNMAAITAAG